MTRDDDGMGCDALNIAGTLVPAAVCDDDTAGTKLTLENLVVNLGGT
jgi:hypothetical protein